MTDHRKAPPWTDEEHAFLEEHRHLTAREVGEALGRSETSVWKKRAKMARGWEPSRDPWSPSDIQFLRDHPNLPAPACATELGTTEERVRAQRKRLSQREGVGFTQKSLRAWHVGPRTLLAKTCPGCGHFLPARWFHFSKRNGGYWITKCYRCSNEGKDFSKYQTPERHRRSRSARQKMQAQSLETATRKSQPWTEADHRILSDPTLSALDKAVKLGRTYYATQHLLRENGYKSKVGLGDPEAAAWVIRFPDEIAPRCTLEGAS